MTHIKQQKYFHHLKGRGYNKNSVLYPGRLRWWKYVCCFICVTLVWALHIVIKQQFFFTFIDIIVECGLMVHAYADDTQVYVATQASDQATAMERCTNCIVKVRDWMASNRLKLNEDKTQVIWLGSRHQLSKLTENTDLTECYGAVLNRSQWSGCSDWQST